VKSEIQRRSLGMYLLSATLQPNIGAKNQQ
jgi:hypothetical protein